MFNKQNFMYEIIYDVSNMLEQILGIIDVYI